MIKLFLIFIFLLASTYMGGTYYFVSPFKSTITAPKDIKYEKIDLKGEGVNISGWYLEGNPELPAIVLLHGYRKDRTSMLERGKWYRSLGLNAFILDLPAHGESGGKWITFGQNERKVIASIISIIKKRHNKVIINGFSLGAVTALMTSIIEPVDGLILEAPFSTLERSIQNRVQVYFGKRYDFLVPITFPGVKLLTKIEVKDVRPIDLAAATNLPIIFLAGEKDIRCQLDEVVDYHRRSPMSEDEVIIFKAAKHDDFFKSDEKLFKRSVGKFLSKYLQF